MRVLSEYLFLLHQDRYHLPRAPSTFPSPSQHTHACTYTKNTENQRGRMRTAGQGQSSDHSLLELYQQNFEKMLKIFRVSHATYQQEHHNYHSPWLPAPSLILARIPNNARKSRPTHFDGINSTRGEKKKNSRVKIKIIDKNSKAKPITFSHTGLTSKTKREKPSRPTNQPSTLFARSPPAARPTSRPWFPTW